MREGFELPTRVGPAARHRLSALAEQQEGVARRAQLYDCGLSPNGLTTMLSAGRWRARGEIIVVLHNGPLTRRQQMWAAVLNAGCPVALAARTAATEHGLSGWDAECVEIVVPKGTLIPKGLGIDVKVHESRRFTADDIHPGRAIPQVRVERALIDAAVWSRSTRTACGVVAAGVQQRLTTPAALRAELERAGAVRHRRVLLAALVDIEGGAQAVSEIDFIRFCRRNGLPRPTLQEVRVDSSGRRRYLDATLRRRDGGVIRVEVDGALHLVASTYWSDMARGNDLVIGNERVLRFPSYVIHSSDPTAVNQLRRALGLSVAGGSIAS
ncbi:MAG TPA: hypothetical protein VHC43_00190 [Mycobacteriales bacterium]|nr:hypothetical protein [Mycobacteriales bacterium]